MTEAKIHPESPEEFEFIETPPASSTTPAEPCGVRTTSVSLPVVLACGIRAWYANWAGPGWSRSS